MPVLCHIENVADHLSSSLLAGKSSDCLHRGNGILTLLCGCQIFKETVNCRPFTGGCVYCTYISNTPVLFHASLCKNVLVSLLLHRHRAHAKGVVSSVPDPPATPPLVRYCKITSSQRYSLHARQKTMKSTSEEEAANQSCWDSNPAVRL